MTQENLLDNSTVDEEVEIDDAKDYFAELVGEGKKYKDTKDLAKAYFHASSALKNREQRLDELRGDFLELKKDADARAKLEDLIGQLDNRRQQQSASNEEPPVKEIREPSFKPEQLDSLVSSKIVEHETRRKEQQNFDTVKAKLTERFGRNYQNVLKDRMVELDLTEEDVNRLARKSPTALFRTLGVEDSRRETFDAPPRSNVQFRPKVESPHKPLSYYQDLRRKDKNLYYDPKIANQMEKDAQALGEAFFDVPE